MPRIIVLEIDRIKCTLRQTCNIDYRRVDEVNVRIWNMYCVAWLFPNALGLLGRADCRLHVFANLPAAAAVRHLLPAERTE